MSRSRLILLVATTALFIGAVVLFMRGKDAAAKDTAAATEQAKAHATSTRAARSNPSTPEGPAARDPRPEPERTLDQINAWLADDSLPSEQAARNLWTVFSDARQTKEVRQEALEHALNLTTDKQLVAEFIQIYGQPGLWSGQIGETALDELYNRGKAAKLSASAALLVHATGEFRDHIRELLRFEVDDPEADDATLIRKAHEKLTAQPQSGQ
ncbi:hypothetical protein KBB96_00530 [Luteolibacter ambystomatis]|uniref:Uncharacterized protein n=1 Tax=Luteolibacter ambystomatis TaxID=2824561 RepID=A0A975G963_9BACT|nr:hypothetical protein [Luteolibacter ambystomatis]QUE51399.1 hypothetical protein KBB96_00530 [Luteolibacter ambystomatis]